MAYLGNVPGQLSNDDTFSHCCPLFNPSLILANGDAGFKCRKKGFTVA